MNLSKWTFIPPMKAGLPHWSKTKDNVEWNKYVNNHGGIKCLVSNGALAQHFKTGAAIGLWSHSTNEGVIYHDIREDGLSIAGGESSEDSLDFTK